MSLCANNQIIIKPKIEELDIDNLIITLTSCGTRIDSIDQFTNSNFDDSQDYVVLTDDDLPPKNTNKEEIYRKLSSPLKKLDVEKFAKSYLISDSKHLFVLSSIYVIFEGLQSTSSAVSGGSKRKSSKKKKGGSVPINSQTTVLQSASYAPSLDNSFLSQSTLVGGKKKRTQKKRKSLKKRSRK